VYYFKKPYEEAFIHTVASLPGAGFQVNEYDTSEGRIFCKHSNGKDMFVLVVPIDEKQTLVRITPIDGVYNFSHTLVTSVINGINKQLAEETGITIALN